MKVSPMLCAALMAFAALAVSTDGVFAATYNTTKSNTTKRNVKASGLTAPNTRPTQCLDSKGIVIPGQKPPCKLAQPACVAYGGGPCANSSRSNIKNN